MLLGGLLVMGSAALYGWTRRLDKTLNDGVSIRTVNHDVEDKLGHMSDGLPPRSRCTIAFLLLDSTWKTRTKGEPGTT